MGLFSIATFIKKNPEKLVFWFLLAIFISLSSYLVISWPQKKAILWEEPTVPEADREPVAKAVVSIDFEDFLIRRPVTYYYDLVQRSPFARRLPGVAIRPNGNIIIGRPVIGLVYRGRMTTPEGPVAFIDGRNTHMAREGDEIEGWRIIKIGKEEVKVYNEREGQELFLPLGGGPEEEERLRRERERRREYRRERDRREGVRFEGMPPWLEGFPPGERRR